MKCEERVIMVATPQEDLADARFLRYQTSVRYRVIPMKIVKELYRVAFTEGRGCHAANGNGGENNCFQLHF